MAKNWFLLLLLAAPVFAQLETKTLTISATRQMNLQPDQAVLYLTVNSGTSTSLDQVVAALSALNVTAANLTGVDNSNPPTLQWTFSLAAPLTSLTTTIASLAKLQQTIGQNNRGLSLTFSINGTQVSSQLQQSQPCSTSDLIADATAQAQKIAAAAGLALGPVLKLSNAPAAEPIAARVGYTFISVTGILSSFLLGPAPQPRTCALSVQFQLLH